MSESVSSHIEVQAPPERVLEVLMDFDAYPEWARQVKVARVLATDERGRASQVEFEVTPGPMPKLHYVLQYAYEPGRMSWTFVSGDVRDIRGAYVLEGSEASTNVTYELMIDPGRIPLPGFVKARAAREITRVALQELKRRVEGD